MGYSKKKVVKWANILARPLLEQVKKSVVFLGSITKDGRMAPKATGFLVNIKSVLHLVTAKHVVFSFEQDKVTDTDLTIFLNTKDGKIKACSIDAMKKDFSNNWIFHQNREVDIAIIPFGLEQNIDDVLFIPNNIFLTPDKLYEVYDIFFLSYQPGIETKQKISPIIRRGAISLMNEDSTFYVDAAVFPGNSGSPVFLKPSLILNETWQYSMIGGVNFIGVIGEYIPYQEVAISTQTHRPRIVFEENTGLSKVWSVSFINEIIDSQAFNDQINKIISAQK